MPTSVIGTKIVSDTGEGTVPEFQGVLISNEPRARGPRPVVWLFHKVLYGSKDPDFNDRDGADTNRDGRQTTTSLVRV